MNCSDWGKPLTTEQLEDIARELVTDAGLEKMRGSLHNEAMYLSWLNNLTAETRWHMWCKGELVLDTSMLGDRRNLETI